MLRPNLRISIAGACAVLATTALAGCAGDPIVDVAYYGNSHQPTEYRAAGSLPVVVRGNPYAIPKDQLDHAVADAMQGTTFGTDTRFFTEAESPPNSYRVVMVFNPGSSTVGYSLCARPEPTGGAAFGQAPAPRVAIGAALCRGDQTMTYAFGSIGTEGGPDGPEFRRGVQRFSMTLFPPRDYDNRGGDGHDKPHI